MPALATDPSPGAVAQEVLHRRKRLGVEFEEDGPWQKPANARYGEQQVIVPAVVALGLADDLLLSFSICWS